MSTLHAVRSAHEKAGFLGVLDVLADTKAVVG
jgi:hypothetical protein